MKLSIVIPAHNEEQRLPPVLKQYLAVFKQNLPNDFEIIVVANGCDDLTADVVNEVAQVEPSVRLIEESGRIGKGGAVILGVKQAAGEYIGFVDADGATAPEEFFRLYQKAVGTDGVIASRWMKGADVQIPQKGFRLLSSRLFNGMTQGLLGLKYKDTQCGAKLFSAAAWKAILPRIGITRFAFDVDVLFQLKRHGYVVREEPTVWKDVEGSKVQFLNSSFDMFCAVVRMRLFYSPFRFAVRWYERFFSRMVEFFLRDDLFRHTSLLFFASIVAAFGNFGFQMVVGRALPKAEFGLLATFLALFLIIQRPLGSLATAMSHYVSLLARENDTGRIGGLLRKWLLRTGLVSGAVGLICIFFAKDIAESFHLNRVAPVIVSALALPVLFMMPVLSGAVRGLERFVWLSASNIVLAVTRLIFGALFTLFVFAACGWALAGHVVGLYAAMLIVLAALWRILFNRSEKSPVLPPSMRSYLPKCFFVQVFMGFLMTGDVVLMRRYLPAETDFAYAATMSRIVATLAVSVVSAMFPKVSSAGTFTRQHRTVYLRSILYTLMFVGVSLVLCVIFPALFHGILFGIEDPAAELIALTRGMALVMTATTLLNINFGLLLAQRRFASLSVVVVCSLLYIVGAHFFHDSGWSIVWLAGIANAVALVVTSISILKRKLDVE